MSVVEWVEENPGKATVLGAAGIVAVAARGRLSEAVYGLTKDVVKAGSIELSPGIQAERIGNNLRFTSTADGLAVDVTKKLLGGHDVTAKLADGSAMMALEKNGVSLRAEGASASIRNYTLRARIDELGPGVKRSPDGPYNTNPIEMGQYKISSREFSGNDFRLSVGKISGPGDPIEVWGGQFGGHRLSDFNLRRGGLALSDGDKPFAIGSEGIRMPGNKGSTMTFDEVAKLFEKRI